MTAIAYWIDPKGVKWVYCRCGSLIKDGAVCVSCSPPPAMKGKRR